VIGEELGLVGIGGLIGLYSLLGFAGFRTAQRAKDHYGKLLAAGLTSLLLVQAVLNLFAVMGLAPLTGVPLPFVSYGNSSLLVSLAAVGLILNVARANERGVAVGNPARGAGRLRVLDGGRSNSRERSVRSGAKSRDSRGRNRRTRRAGHGGRRRASGQRR
jgi:cell division protein FtsW